MPILLVIYDASAGVCLQYGNEERRRIVWPNGEKLICAIYIDYALNRYVLYFFSVL